MNKNKSNEVWEEIQKHVKAEIRKSPGDNELWNSTNEKDEKAQNMLKFVKYKKAAEAKLSAEHIQAVTKKLIKAFMAYEKQKRHEKAEKGARFSFRRAENSNTLKRIESRNICSLINCYYSESANHGNCGYVSILKACGSQKDSELTYDRFFEVLKGYKVAIDNSLKLNEIDQWRAYLDEDSKSLVEKKLFDVIYQEFFNKADRDKCAFMSILAVLSEEIIKNKEKIKSEAELFQMKDIVQVRKNLLAGMKDLAEDYSHLLKTKYSDYETEDGKGDPTKINKLPAQDITSTIQKFYPVTIRKYDVGEDGALRRYAYQQAFMGCALRAKTKDDSTVVTLKLKTLDDLSLGIIKINELPQSDDDLKKDITIKYTKEKEKQAKVYDVQFQKPEKIGTVELEFEYLIGLSKKINKPVFCLSSRENCAGLFVFDASKIGEEGNDEHSCRFCFSITNELDQRVMSDKQIEYYSRLATNYSKAIKDNKNPVLFFSPGHYTYLDPSDTELRQKFADEIKGIFFNRYIEEYQKRATQNKLNQQTEKLKELEEQMKKLNVELDKNKKEREGFAQETKTELQEIESKSKQQTIKEKELTDKEKELNQKAENIKKQKSELENKQKLLNEHEQNLKTKEKYLMAREGNIKTLNEQLKEKEKKADVIENDAKEKNQRLNQLERDKKNLEAELSKLKFQLSEEVSKNNRLNDENEKKLTQAKLEIEKLTNANKELNDKLNIAKSKIDVFEKDKQLFESNKKELDKMAKDIEMKESQLADYKNKFNEREKTVETLKLQLKNNESELNKFKKDTNIKKQAIAQLNDNNKKLKKELKQTKDKLEKQIEELNIELNKNKKEKETLEKKTKVELKEIESKSEQQTIKEKELTDKEKELNQKTENIKKQKSELENKQKLLNEHEQNLKTKEKQLIEREGNIKTLNEQLKEKEKKADAIENDAEEKNQRLNWLESDKKNLEIELSKLKSQINKIDKNNRLNNENEKKLTQAKSEIEKLTNINKKLTDELNITKSKIDVFEKDKQLLENRQKELDKMAKDIKTRELSLVADKNKLIAEQSKFDVQHLDETQKLYNKLSGEKDALNKQLKNQKRLLDECQNKIGELEKQNNDLRQKSNSVNRIQNNEMLQPNQKESNNVLDRENKNLRMKLIGVYLDNIKLKNTHTIIYVFAWMFQWALSICKDYVEKFSYEKILKSEFNQLKQNWNIDIDNGDISNLNDNLSRLIENILSGLDVFIPKYCDNNSRNQLLDFYSALLYFHQHDTKNIIGYLHTIDNGDNYIDLINKNVLNIPKNMINGGNQNLKNSFNEQLPI